MTLPPPPPPAPDWALFLDLDGTLTPLRPHPDDVLIDDTTRRALDVVARRLDGAVCVASGRPRHELRRLLPGIDDLMLVGCHGGEGLDDAPCATVTTALAEARAALAPLAERFAGVWFEDKPVGFAIHYRRFPHAGPALLREALAVVGTTPGLRVVAGHAVVEVMPADVSKGRVLERVSARPGFAGRRPIAIGDDVTDEDAFVAAARLGGFGVLVGHRDVTAARHALPDAAATSAWLQQAACHLPEWPAAASLGPEGNRR